MDKFRGNPDSKKPNYHGVLRSADGQSFGIIAIGTKGEPDPDVIGRNPVETSSLKTSTGTQQYSDQKPPYTTIAQDDFSGGRGNLIHERDTTRFYDSWRVNTARVGRAILNGRETYGTGLRSEERNLPGSMRLLSLTGGSTYRAKRLQVSPGFTAAQLMFWVRRKGTPHSAFTAKLRADSTGAIGSTLKSATLAVADIPALLSYPVIFSFTGEVISNNTYVWVEACGHPEDDENNHWEIGVKKAIDTTYRSPDDSAWTADTYDLYYRLVATPLDQPGYLFQYMGSQYFISQPADGTAAKLWINGVRGAAISNAANKTLLNAAGSPGWEVGSLVGGVAVVIDGDGSLEAQNWREIVENGTDYVKTNDSTPWLITHSTNTSFVVIGANAWTEITGHGLTAPVTCVKVSSQDVVYFCQGEVAAMRRMREYNNAGTWTRDFAADGTSKAIFVEEYNEAGTMKMLRSNGDTTISKCSNASGTPAWGTDLTWNTSKKVGDKWDRITGLARYVDEDQEEAVWLMKEAGPWVFKGGTTDSIDRIKLDEFRTVMSSKNGRAWARQGVYLWYSVTNSVHKFYHPTLEDVGPTLGEGLPPDRQGPIVAALAYPGRMLAAIDAGVSGYSSVLENNGGDSWHEVHRAPYGQRIYDLDFQVIPGDMPDRLWVRQGADIVWLPFPSDTFDPFQDENYPFTHEGMVQLSGIFAGLMDAWKYWATVKLQAENMINIDDEQITWMEADYKLDSEEDWHGMPDRFEEAPFSESEFGETFGVASRKLELRIRMYSTDQRYSPKLLAVIIQGVAVVAPKFSYMLQAQVGRKDLLGELIETSPVTRVRQLDTWCGTAMPLLLECVNPLYNNTKVFLMPVPLRPLATAVRAGKYDYVVSLVVQEA